MINILQIILTSVKAQIPTDDSRDTINKNVNTPIDSNL